MYIFCTEEESSFLQDIFLEERSSFYTFPSIYFRVQWNGQGRTSDLISSLSAQTCTYLPVACRCCHLPATCCCHLPFLPCHHDVQTCCSCLLPPACLACLQGAPACSQDCPATAPAAAAAVPCLPPAAPPACQALLCRRRGRLFCLLPAAACLPCWDTCHHRPGGTCQRNTSSCRREPHPSNVFVFAGAFLLVQGLLLLLLPRCCCWALRAGHHLLQGWAVPSRGAGRVGLPGGCCHLPAAAAPETRRYTTVRQVSAPPAAPMPRRALDLRNICYLRIFNTAGTYIAKTTRGHRAHSGRGR